MSNLILIFRTVSIGQIAATLGSARDRIEDGMPNPRRYDAYIVAAVRLNKLWGSAALGLYLARSHLAGHAVTADSVAAEIDVSDDTARRWLGRLVSEGKATVRIDRGRRYYYAIPSRADETFEIVKEAHRIRPQSAVE